MGDEFERPALLLAVGLYIGANSLGGIGGRVIGGAVAEVGGAAASFMTVGAVTLVGLALFWRLLPPPRGFTPRRFAWRAALADLGGHLATPRLFGAYLLGGLNFMIFINQYSYLTFRLAEAPFGLGATSIGLIFLTYLGGTLGSSLSGRLAARWAQPACMMLGIGLLAVGTALTLAGSLAWIIAGLSLNAFGFFLAHSMASSWVGRHARRARGSASALYLVFYYGGASLGGLWLEPFWQSAGWLGVALGSWLVLGAPWRSPSGCGVASAARLRAPRWRWPPRPRPPRAGRRGRRPTCRSCSAPGSRHSSSGGTPRPDRRRRSR